MKTNENTESKAYVVSGITYQGKQVYLRFSDCDSAYDAAVAINRTGGRASISMLAK